MRSGTSKLEFLVLHPIDQNPVWFDVGVADSIPPVPERMITIRSRQFLLGNQQGD